MTDQPALFDLEPPRDPVRCPRCGWRGEGGELAQTADEWGACEACPERREETIMEGGVNEQDEALVFFGK